MFQCYPLVSVIITTYNRKDRLKQAIDSVVNQTYKNIEIIVVDDNLENSEYRIFVENLMQNYPFIIYVRNKNNLGGALSRNIGVNTASGEFIAFLDDDDTYKSEKIMKQYNCYLDHEKNNVGLIYCYATRVNDTGEAIGIYKNDYEGNPLYEQMLECIAGTSLWFCPKDSLYNVNLFENTPNKQDSIVLLKILAAGYNVFRVPEELVNYTEHEEGRISGFKLKNIQGICNLREWSRKFYNLINVRQVKRVEYNFARILIGYYVYNKQNYNALKSLYVMMSISLLSKETLVSTLKCMFPHLYRLFIQNHKELL